MKKVLQIFSSLLILAFGEASHAQCVNPPVAGHIWPLNYIVCDGGSDTLVATGAVADSLQWQISSNGNTWNTAPGNSNDSVYITPNLTVKTYFRMLSHSDSCFDISSQTAIFEISQTPVPVFTTVQDTYAILTWSPKGYDNYKLKWTGGGTSDSLVGTAPPDTLTGLLPNTNYTIEVTMLYPTCAGTGSGGSSGPPTVCTPAPGPTVIANNQHQLIIQPVGTPMTVYYKAVLIQVNWHSVSVGNSPVTLSGVIAGVPYQFYNAAPACPFVGFPDASSITTVYTPGAAPGCGIPGVNAVAACSQITGSIGGGATCHLYWQRVYPNPNNATGTYLSSGPFVINISPSNAGSKWQVYGNNVCQPNSSPVSIPVLVEIPAGCPAVDNLVLSNPTCYGFTATWNNADCGTPVSNYRLFVRELGSTTWSVYNNGTSNIKVFNSFSSGHTKQVYAKARPCGTAYGPASTIQTISTLPAGSCRIEDEQAGDEPEIFEGTVNGNLSLFPNPCSKEFFIDLQNNDGYDGIAKVELINSLGQCVMTHIVNSEDGHLTDYFPVEENYSQGVYLVKITIDEKEFISRVTIVK